MDVCHIAKTAGRMLRDQLGCPGYVSLKGWANLVADVDLKVQYFIEASLKEFDSSIPVMAEEQSAKPVHSKVYWVVDPIDGTTNFVHDYPSIATSISLLDRVGLACAWFMTRLERVILG
jgi:myo-inositol-1(or 4)-monophosphatase